MALPNSTATRLSAQADIGPYDIKAFLNSVDATALLARLRQYRWTGSRWRGRSGYSIESLWRALLLGYILNTPSTSSLIRRLQDDPRLRRICGFTTLPHRSTFSRFFARVSLHLDLVQLANTTATNRLREYLPNLGNKVAVDSTFVRSHSNPKRHQISDTEATWTAKTSTSPGAKNGKEWSFGYKLHMVADAEYGIPLWSYLTTASRNDTLELPTLLDGAASAYPWFRPGYVIGDKGYDSQANHSHVIQKGAVPVIHIRRAKNQELQDGLYTNEGVPTCIGKVPMEYVSTDPEKGRLYRCPDGGCALRDRKGVRYCHDEIWEKPEDNPRLFGMIRRDSQEWKHLYSLRQAIERIFKSMKQSRRLEDHCLRGFLKIATHAALAVLAFSATVLARLRLGNADGRPCWMVRKVA